MTMTMAIGCVAENTPKYLSQALRLVQSIRWFGGSLNRAELYVCVVDGVRAEYQRAIERFGATVRIVPRFSDRHPQSNKLRFLEMPELAGYERVLLLDCDTVVVRDPLPDLIGADFNAKIVDCPTVPLETFQRLFAAFDLHMPTAIHHCTVCGGPMIPYFNAGVLAFSRRAVDTLVPIWLDLNRRLIDAIELLEGHDNYCEQASLAMALAKTEIHYEVLGNAFNFPMHFEKSDDTPELVDVDPYIVHYHWLSDATGNIKPSAFPAVNRRIGEFNVRLRQEREHHFDNQLFWNQRYEENPERGSGLGSRGENRDIKRRLLAGEVSRWRPNSILDVGCGDLEVGSALPAHDYLGVDFSDVVVNANRNKHPDRAFLAGNFLDLEIPSADMVVCLDVLIHLASPEQYRNFVGKLVHNTRRVGIVSGDESDPDLAGIVFFHEPLSRTLALAGARNIRRIGGYRHVSVFMYTAPDSPQLAASADAWPASGPEGSHPRDISAQDYAQALQLTADPDLLRDIVSLSRASLGFFTSHFPRTLEYPWLLRQLSGATPASLLDIGAGVSPVPLFLADAGHNVMTVDSHPLIRTLARRAEWDEWGFLDYRQLHPRIESLHRTAQSIRAFRAFDVVYSISVIEHMPSAVRRRVIQRSSFLLKPGGRFLLTLDLAPTTQDLWNYSDGKIVEPQGHGTVKDVLTELGSYGFLVDDEVYYRTIPNSRVDVVCIAATLHTDWLTQAIEWFKALLRITRR